MPDYSAGTASVRIRPNADDFVRDLSAKLKAVRDPGFTVSVSADTGQAAADIRRFREVESRNGMKLGVDVALGQAQADMAAFRARQRADGLTIKVDADTKAAETRLAALDRQAKSLGSMRDVLRLNVGAGLVAGIGPAVTGLVELAGALQQVSSAALAVPGGIAGAAASIGTLVIGLSGVSDAYKAVSAAADSSGKDQAAAARAGVSASNNLRNAVVDEARARKDVAQATRDARNELRDLHIEMRGGLINESRAILQAQQARERLAKGDYTDIRDALLDIQEADQRVLEVQSRNAEQAEKLNDARAKGVEGSDRVVAANEALVRSQQQVTEAQMAAADAATTSSSAQTKAAQEMAKLGPNTQKFVETLVRMRPEFNAFRSAAAEPLLAGKAEEFEKFFGTVAPHIKSGMSQIATGWNQNISALFRSVSSSTGTGFIDRILGNTSDAQGRLTKAVDPLVRLMGTLSSAGSDVLPRLADATGRWADRMAAAVTEADNNGSLDAMINRALDGMTNLGNGAINLGKSLNAITTAAGGGGSFLQWIQDSTDRMQKFLNSGEGQNKLRDYFAEGRELISKVVEVLKELPGAMSGVQDAAHEYLGGALAVIRDLASLMKEHPDLIKAVVLGYAAFKTVTPIMQGVGTVITGISTGLTALGTGFADARAKATDNFGKIQTKFDEAGGPKGLGKFSGALSVLGAAGGPFGILAGTIASVAVPALMSLRDAHADAEKKVSDLNQRELELEATLDRVTGKMTAQSRDMLLQQAQSYNPQGPGAGIPGISQGDALKAATSLGINPKTYGDALAGNPAAQQQVRDILTKNNLLPEFMNNPALTQIANDVRGATGNKINQDQLIAALIGAPGADQAYKDAFQGSGIDPTTGKYSLAQIAEQLSATGRASVLAGGALTYLSAGGPGASQNVQERNQANYGRFRLSAAGRGFFGGDLQVNSSGSDYQIVAPELTPGLQASLQASNLPYKVNADGRSITITVPSGSPYIESYAKGGPTPNGRGTGPTGGHIVEVHGDEWILPAGARAAVGDKTLAALTAGRSFDVGGPEEDIYGPANTNPGLNNPGVVGGPVAAPATVPIAQNPMGATGGIGNIFGQVLSGLQGPIGNAVSLAQAGASMVPGAAGGGSAVDPATTVHGAGAGALPGPAGGGVPAMDAGATFATRLSGVPGIAGLIGSAMSPNPGPALMSWGSKTAQYVANWGMDTLGKVGSTLWSGALGFFGLENSILSPSNPYNQAAQQTGQFFLGQEGPIGQLLGMGKGGTNSTAGLVDPASLGAQYNVDDATLATLFGQTGDQSILAAMSPGARAAITYAQQHAIGQKYEYGGVGNTGGYDCSGIASAIYAAARGLPQGQRYFTTESDFEALGFVQGYKPGALNIGVMRGGGGPNSHMAVTLPNGVAVESGGAHGTTSYGGDARGANTFPLQWHMDLPQGFEKGGPTPDVMGPVDSKGGHLAVVHPKEFMISARGRAAVNDEFLHKLNRGIVDPTELGLRGYAVGGPIPFPTAAVQPSPPPSIAARTPIQTMNPAPVRPPTAAVTPSPRPAVTAPAPAPATAVPPTNAPQEPQQPRSTAAATAGPTQLAPNNGAGNALNHNIGWLNTAIESGASTLGNLASTAMSIAAMGAGGAGIPGAGAIGAAGPFVAGLFKEGGKIVEGAVNVVSSSLVGNVPGSFGGPAGANPYGRVVRPEQDAPATASPRSTINNFNGISDINRLMDRIELNDKLSNQAALAKYGG